MQDITINLTFDATYPISVVMLALNRLDDGQELTLSNDPAFTAVGGGVFSYPFQPPARGLHYIYRYLATWSDGTHFKGRGWKDDIVFATEVADVVLNIKTAPPPAASGVLLSLKRLDNGSAIVLPNPAPLTGPDGHGVFSYPFPPPAANLKYTYTYLLTWSDDTTYQGTGFKQDSQVKPITAAPLDNAMLAVVDAVLRGISGKAVLRFVPNFYEPLSGLITQHAQQWEVPCSPPYGFKKSLINGSNIKVGDFQLILPAKSLIALDILPDTSMTIIRGVSKYTIIDVTPLNAGNADVAYILHCRNS